MMTVKINNMCHTEDNMWPAMCERNSKDNNIGERNKEGNKLIGERKKTVVGDVRSTVGY